MHNGLHHISVRKRIYQKKEAYPHPSKALRITDDFAYFFGVAGPLMSIPQLLDIWVKKDVSGVSLLSWSAFTLASLFWIWYGTLHKEPPIIISQILWFLLQLGIVVGILIYR